jgi:hypothetical protein
MWYFAQAGQQQGPVSDEQIKRMARDGSLGKEDLVWREGMASWQPAGEVPGFEFTAPAFTPPPPPASPVPVVIPPPPPPAAMAPPSYSAPQVQAPPDPYGAPPPVYGQPAYGQQQQAGTDIPDLLVFSIVATLVCCMPAGIAAIVFASKANSAKKMGDFETARKAAKQAKTWLIVSVVAGVLVVLIGIAVQIMTVASQH